MAVRERETVADHGLLATLRELLGEQGGPVTSEAIAAAVRVPGEYSDFIEQRLEQNERRGLVARDDAGRWLLTADGTSAATAAPHSR
jgi:hypothetical protein